MKRVINGDRIISSNLRREKRNDSNREVDNEERKVHALMSRKDIDL